MEFVDEYQLEVLRTFDYSLEDEEALKEAGLGIGEEAGEVMSLIKKILFHGHEIDRVKILEELGDVQWYVSAIAILVGFSPKEVMEANIEKLRKRYPNGFSREDSIDRVDTK